MANADPALLNAAAKVAVEAKLPDTKAEGIPPEQLRRCLNIKARAPKGVDAPKSADDLVLLEKQTSKLREQCVRSLANKYGDKAKPKKTAAK